MQQSHPHQACPQDLLRPISPAIWTTTIYVDLHITQEIRLIGNGGVILHCQIMVHWVITLPALAQVTRLFVLFKAGVNPESLKK